VLLAAVARVRANELCGRSKQCKHITKLEGTDKFQRSKAGPDVLFGERINMKEGKRVTGAGSIGMRLDRRATARRKW
jgi:hypothetical protein